MSADSGINFSVKNIDIAPIRRALQAGKQRAQMKLDAAALKDCNHYVPLDTGMLQKSAITNTVIGSGRIVWQTPYARAQYYGDFDHSAQHNPGACGKWCEAAKAVKQDEWKKIVEDEIESGL